MKSRKEMKKQARLSLKKHYFMFVAVCLLAAFLGSEFSLSINVTSSNQVESAPEGGSGGILERNFGLSDVWEDILSGRVEEGKAVSREFVDQAVGQSQEDHPVLGRSRGVLAQAVNAVTSGSILVTILSAVNSIVGSTEIAIGVMVALSAIFAFSMWFFLKNMFTVVSRRIFLEGRCYDRLSIQRFLFLFRVKKWVRVSWVMFVTSVYQALWSMTIAGGVIKRYSYYLVPYITAENPAVSARQAITLSRRMMKGHKWQCFVFELSFLGWYILEILTLGLSGILFSNPYMISAFSEYYAQLRSMAKNAHIEGGELLNDHCLFEKPDVEQLQQAYADVIELLERHVDDMQELKGLRRFLAEWFGVLLSNTKEEKAYEESQAEQVRIYVLRDAFEGRSYPDRLFPIPEVQKRKKVETLHYLRNYSIWSLVMLFFVFSAIGWLWEVSLHLITDGVFVNRGVMHGPWLPIYGSGGVLILVVLKKLRKYPVREFLGIIILCGIVEYFTSYYLEVTHDGKKWWDYTGYFLNLHGRICAEGLLVFGLGGMAITYVLAPVLDNYIKRVQFKILVPVCILLLGTFIADQLYSSKHPNTGKGITDYTEASAKNQGQMLCQVQEGIDRQWEVVNYRA